MDATQFDRFTASLPRRSALGGVVALALGVSAAEAKKKKAKPNQFGCLNVGQPCRGQSSQCCSGICEGKKPKKGKKDKSRCLAHDASTCQAGVHPAICGSTNQSCLTSFGNGGSCATTTGNAGYCFNSDPLDDPPCTRDPDCEAVAGPGAACIVCPSTGIPNCVGILDF